MARPLDFEVRVECKDPRREYEKVLSRCPSSAAVETLRRIKKAHEERRGDTSGNSEASG